MKKSGDIVGNDKVKRNKVNVGNISESDNIHIGDNIAVEGDMVGENASIIDGKIKVSGEDTDEVIGIDAGGKQVILKPGQITDVSARGAKTVTGVKI